MFPVNVERLPAPHLPRIATLRDVPAPEAFDGMDEVDGEAHCLTSAFAGFFRSDCFPVP